MKILFLAMVLCLSGCATTKVPNIIPLQISTTPLDLSAYKDMSITVVDNNMCYSYDDYTKPLELLNKLKDYIVYQQSVIQKIDGYYNPKK